MLCALTVRNLKPDTFESFKEAFLRNDDPDNPPAGWVRFNMLRNTENPDQVITFGFFDGTVEELRSSSADEGYSQTLEEIAPYVESVGADAIYDIVEEYTAAGSGARG